MTKAEVPVARDLDALFDPRSVAVVGASNDPLKWGYGLSRGALRGSARRDVYLVNRNGSEVLGRASYRSLEELPGSPELVVLAVPATGFDEAVDQALAAGARAIVAITAGLGETDDEGRAREQAAAERIRASGAVLLGPNCLGVFDAAAELDIGWSELPPGEIGLISQSGNLALELALIAADHGLGFSRFASLGNQADLEAAELVTAFAAHEGTRVVALYVEDFRDGRAFAGACHAASTAGKPVVLLAAGASDAAGRAARSHTGALVSDFVAVQAACRAAGIEQVSTPRELIDTAQALLSPVVPRGRRVFIFGDGGGHAVIAADLASAASLELPVPGEELTAQLASALGPSGITGNPIDFAGAGERSIQTFSEVARLLLGSGEADAAVVTGYFGGYAEYGDDFEAQETEIARAMAQAVRDAGRPLVVQTMYPRGPAAAALRKARIPVYGDIADAIGGLARLVERFEQAPVGVPRLPAPAADAGGSVAGPAPAGGYFEAREFLQGAGIRFAEARRVETLAEARSAARDLGFPVVLKALGLLHKSDAGGVVLGIGSEEELERVFSDMATRLSPAGYSVERTAAIAGGIELIVGVRRDPRFGPIALAGMGGVYAELLEDVAVALAPIDEREAAELLRSLRGAPLLDGARGRPALAVSAAAGVLSALSQAAARRPEIAEVEINPLLVTADEALGLDARIILADA